MNLNLNTLNSFKYLLIYFTNVWVEQDYKTFNYTPYYFFIHTMQAGGIGSPSLLLGCSSNYRIFKYLARVFICPNWFLSYWICQSELNLYIWFVTKPPYQPFGFNIEFLTRTMFQGINCKALWCPNFINEGLQYMLANIPTDHKPYSETFMFTQLSMVYFWVCCNCRRSNCHYFISLRSELSYLRLAKPREMSKALSL